MPYWTILFYFARTGGRGVKANHIFIAAVRQHFTINALGAAHGLRWARTRGRGTVHGAFERDAHFILILVLLSRQVNQQNNKSDACDNDQQACLIFTIRPLHSLSYFQGSFAHVHFEFSARRINSCSTYFRECALS